MRSYVHRKYITFLFFLCYLLFSCQTISFADSSSDNTLIVDSIITSLQEDFHYTLADTEDIAINYQTIETLASKTQSRVFLYVQLEIFTPYGGGTYTSKFALSAPFEVYIVRDKNQGTQAVAASLYDAVFDACQIWPPNSDSEYRLRAALKRRLSAAQYETALRFLKADQEVPKYAMEFIAAMSAADKQALKRSLQDTVQKRLLPKTGKSFDPENPQPVSWTDCGLLHE